MGAKLKLNNMEHVEVETIHWVWEPYIPYGKLTIVQGDPGEGKTTFVLSLIALLTTGQPLPERNTSAAPINVIYQTAEDGLADTIKPRLLAAGADCSHVLVIDESEKELTMCDERLEEAILKTGARLVVLDPMQAYLGGSVDMHRANEVRPVFKRLAALAENIREAFETELEAAYYPEQTLSKVEQGAKAARAPASTVDPSSYFPTRKLDNPYGYINHGDLDINLGTGSYIYRETDLVVPGVNGLDLKIERQFDSSFSMTAMPYGFDNRYQNYQII